MNAVEQGASNKLQGYERLHLWLLCVAVVVLFSLAAGVGMFSLSPDGHFQIGPGTPSHDPSKYRWWLQDGLGALPLLIEEGVLIGSLAWLFLLVPMACIIAALLSFVPICGKVARRLLSVHPLLLYLSSIVVGRLAGLASTISSGVFPGICC